MRIKTTTVTKKLCSPKERKLKHLRRTATLIMIFTVLFSISFGSLSVNAGNLLASTYTDELFQNEVLLYTKNGAKAYESDFQSLHRYRRQMIGRFNETIENSEKTYKKMSLDHRKQYENEWYYNCLQPLKDSFYKCGDILTDKTSNGIDCRDAQTELSNLMNKYNELRNKFSETAALDNYSSNKTTANTVNSILDIGNNLWKQIGNAIKAASGQTSNYAGIGFAPTQMQAIANQYSPVIKAFAYSLAVVLFGVNVIETSLQYELLTLKGGCKIFGRLLVAKVLIDVSINISIYIISIINSLAQQIVAKADLVLTFRLDSSKLAGEGSSLPIVGPVIDILTSMLNWGPMLLLMLVVIVCALAVFIKLIIRTIELTAMVVISPLFFACSMGDTTKRYFEKFIVSLLSVGLSIVFIAVIYSMGCSWLNAMQHPNITTALDATQWFSTFFYRYLVLIAITICICKPPKVLSSLLS